MTLALGWLWRASVLGFLAFAVFGPLANLLLWAFAIQWYYPHRLPLAYGFRYWGEVFKPTSDAFASLSTSVLIGTITVVVCLLLAIPAGYALSRRRLPGRGFILIILLLPQAFPSVAIYFNIARLFYKVGLNGTIAGVVLVHAAHGLVIAVWIAAAYGGARLRLGGCDRSPGLYDLRHPSPHGRRVRPPRSHLGRFDVAFRAPAGAGVRFRDACTRVSLTS